MGMQRGHNKDGGHWMEGDRRSPQGHHGVMRGQGSHLGVTMGMGGGETRRKQGTGVGDSGHGKVTTGTERGLGVNSRCKEVTRGPGR